MFVLDLSLLGWGILGVITLGFSNLLFFNPYKECIYAELYMNIRKQKIDELINNEKPFLIGVNAILPGYDYDRVLFVNKARYTFAKEVYTKDFKRFTKILLSNIKTDVDQKEEIINYERVIKRGWPHFDNAVITCLRLLHILHVKNVLIAGFDGFKTKYNESYADESLPNKREGGREWRQLGVKFPTRSTEFVTRSERVSFNAFFSEKS